MLTPAVPLPTAAREGRDAGFRRAETVAARAAYGHLADLLAERGWRGARIGFDLAFWPAADWAEAAPFLDAVRPVDASGTVDRLRAIKTPGERDRLARAAALAEAGYRQLLDAVTAGAGATDLTATRSAGVDAAVAGSPATAGPKSRVGAPVPAWSASRAFIAVPV